MQIEQQPPSDTLQRINTQLAIVERTIADLLTGVEISDLSSHQRLNLAVKLMGLHTKVLQLRQACELAEPRRGENSLIVALMRKMRGEELSHVASGDLICDM